MTSLNQQPGPSGSGGSALKAQLTGSLFIEECKQAIEAARQAKVEWRLNIAAQMIDSPSFSSLPDNEQTYLMALYSEATFAVTGYGA